VTGQPRRGAPAGRGAARLSPEERAERIAERRRKDLHTVEEILSEYGAFADFANGVPTGQSDFTKLDDDQRAFAQLQIAYGQLLVGRLLLAALAEFTARTGEQLDGIDELLAEVRDGFLEEEGEDEEGEGEEDDGRPDALEEPPEADEPPEEDRAEVRTAPFDHPRAEE
jgi:hypothetical protein